MKMKNNYIILIIGILTLGIGLAYFLIKNNNGSISIHVTESEQVYKFAATYNETKSQKIKQYIDDCLKPESIFKNSDKVDALIILDDRTRFNIKATPGRLHIKLDKSENSEASIVRIRKICQGIKEIIGEK